MTLILLLALSGAGILGECEKGPDADRDGIPDSCELDLARTFAPVMVVSAAACNWSESAGRLEGAYLFGVHPRGTGFRLVYLPAYLMDCGWSGAKCMVRMRGGCDPHPADSEFIVVDVAPSNDSGELEPVRVFLSAHCFGSGDGGCRWFDRSELQWWGDQPFVWIAEGKNANYPSEAACDRGHMYFDTCDRNDRSVHFPVRSLERNIGSFDAPFPHEPEWNGCVGPPDLDAIPDSPDLECVWTDEAFRGWGGTAVEGVTPYKRYLGEIAQMIPPSSDGRS